MLKLLVAGLKTGLENMLKVWIGNTEEIKNFTETKFKFLQGI